jgi:DNA-binding MarR family transcriptional regulator
MVQDMTEAALRQPGQDAALSDLGDLGERLAFLLKRTQLLFARQHIEVLARHGLTEAEFALLTLIVAAPGASQRQLGSQLYIDRTTIVALVDALEEKRLVSRGRSTVDRRQVAVSPTAAGRRRLARATEAVRQAEDDFLAPLSSEQRELLRASLVDLIASEPQ